MNSLEGFPKSAFPIPLDGSPASANVSKGQDDESATSGGRGVGDFAELLSSLAVADEKSRSFAARGASSDAGQADLHERRKLPETGEPMAVRGTIADAPALFSRLPEARREDCAADDAEPSISDRTKPVAFRRRDAEDALGALVGSGESVLRIEASAPSPSDRFDPASKTALEISVEVRAPAKGRDGAHLSGVGRGSRLDPGPTPPLAPREAIFAPAFPFNPQRSIDGDLAIDTVVVPDKSLPASVERLPWRIGERRRDFPRQESAEEFLRAVAARQAESPRGADPRRLVQLHAIDSAGRDPDISFAAAGKISVLDQQTFLPPAGAPSLANQLALLIGAEAAPIRAAPDSASDPSGLGGAANIAPAAPRAPLVKVLTLQLQPERLGVVTISMRLSGAQLDLQLEASNPDAVRLIDGDRELLAQRLRALGISMDALVIKTAESAAHAPAVHHTHGDLSASPIHAEPSSASTPQEGEFARHDRSARARDHEPARTGSTSGVFQGVGDDRSAGELYI